MDVIDPCHRAGGRFKTRHPFVDEAFDTDILKAELTETRQGEKAALSWSGARYPRSR